MFRLLHEGQLINIPRIIVHSDWWAAYRQISDIGFGHEAVDQKLHFVKLTHSS